MVFFKCVGLPSLIYMEKGSLNVRLNQWEIWKMESLDGRVVVHPQAIWLSPIWKDNPSWKCYYPLCKHMLSQNVPLCVSSSFFFR